MTYWVLWNLIIHINFLFLIEIWKLFFLPTIVLLLLVDLTRLVFRKPFCNWNHRYAQNNIYSLGDFLFNDSPHVTMINLVLFCFITSIHKLITLVQILITLDILTIMLFKHFIIKKKIILSSNDGGLIFLLFYYIPSHVAFIFFYLIIYEKKFPIQEFKTVYINFTYIVIFKRTRWNINNSLIILKYFKNFLHAPEWSKSKFKVIVWGLERVIKREFKNSVVAAKKLYVLYDFFK